MVSDKPKWQEDPDVRRSDKISRKRPYESDSSNSERDSPSREKDFTALIDQKAKTLTDIITNNVSVAKTDAVAASREVSAPQAPWPPKHWSVARKDPRKVDEAFLEAVALGREKLPGRLDDEQTKETLKQRANTMRDAWSAKDQQLESADEDEEEEEEEDEDEKEEEEEEGTSKTGRAQADKLKNKVEAMEAIAEHLPLESNQHAKELLEIIGELLGGSDPWLEQIAAFQEPESGAPVDRETLGPIWQSVLELPEIMEKAPAKCEIRAHAICNFVAAQTSIPKTHIKKIWAEAAGRDGLVHAARKWKYHVAAVVTTSSGDMALDPVLFQGPVPVDVWQQAFDPGKAVCYESSRKTNAPRDPVTKKFDLGSIAYGIAS